MASYSEKFLDDTMKRKHHLAQRRGRFCAGQVPCIQPNPPASEIPELKVQFGSDLNDARIAIAGDSAEQAVRVGERSKGAGIGVIQHVGCFAAQLKAEAVAEQKVFGSRHVPVFIAGTAQYAASCV